MKNRSNIVLVTRLVGILLVAVSTAAAEQTIFFDNFDSYPEGANLSGGGYGGWTGRWGGNITVSAEEAVSPSQCAKMDNSGGCWESQLEQPLPYHPVIWFSADIMGKKTGRVGCHQEDVAIRLFNPNEGGTWGSQMLAISLRCGVCSSSEPVTQAPGLVAYTSFYQQGDIYQRRDLAVIDPDYESLVGRWINIAARFDRERCLADIWVDGSHRATLAIDPCCPVYSCLTLDCSNGIGYVDNVRVFVVDTHSQLKAPWRGIAKISQGNNSSYSHNRCYMREFDPYNCAWENTYAIDVNLPVGSDVLAPADGEVNYIDENPSGSGGIEMAIDHISPTGGRFTTVYLHLNQIFAKSGTVKQGQVIAKSGATGTGSGAHLHFHIWDRTGSRDSHTLPLERLVLKQIGVDAAFKEYDARKGDLDDIRIGNKYFESNNALSAIKITAHSPVDLVVTDPKGFVISKQLNQTPGASYLEYDIDNDGGIEDIIDIPKRAIGSYSIEVIPEPNALATETYSITLETESMSAILADNVPVQNIPTQPYEFESKLNFSDFDTDGDVDSTDLVSLCLRWLGQDCNYPDWCQGADLNYDGLINFVDFTFFAEDWLWGKIPADVDIDGNVDLLDYAVLAAHWLEQNCTEPNWCGDADLNRNGQIDIFDLEIFAGHWLEDAIP